MQGNGTITLREQVELFAKTKATILRAGLVGRESLDGLLGRSLFVISTGGNDFGAFDDPGGVPLSQAPEFMAGMVADYLDYINVLYKLGARRLVLLDVLPVGCLPSQRATTADGECDGDGNYLSELFNSLLRAEMAKAAAASMPAMRYSIASLYNVLTDMIANPTVAGLREVKTACCGGGRFNGEVECSVDTNLCADRDEYLFWDTVHGTQAAYRRAVQAFFYGTRRQAEPINLHQLLQEQYSKATA
jgi:phospholipase/lecithinase/hemolysin